MAPLLSWSCRPLLLLPLIGICFTKFARDGVRSELHIFHHSCALKKDEGPCKAIKDRFYFDIDTGRCELFEYGGCQGNANNFETLQECEEMCLVKEDKSPCHLEDEPGPCRGLVPRYFFDYKSQECKRFFYGGCFGNGNNFKTIKECHERCLPASNHMEQNAPLKPEEEEAKPKTEPLAKHVEAPLNASHLPLRRMSKPSAQEAEFNPPEFCLSPVDRGNCEGSERRFVYNTRTERCQMFRYSGCGGNKNNFVHKRHCMKMCMKDHRRKQIRIKTRNSNILFRSV
ncbi:tissue factor pathway inhibitor-like isoform X2 [Sinocyclocheilus rhinocerous]|uniref:tissue factor pathway inhibitor-like isoform X2 n=1 Tax=Sinocyclocheilus rhinocerous TaxID=307959 RepID=UPI0007B798B6|nr:PREDICTED: tissue factor pathway inhibitor-like isoform X2 [Sinocyclocheilus rhinocerous]